MREASNILIRNIFHMLCYAFKVLKQRNYQDILSEEFAHVEDMLAAILSRGISQQLKQGLYKSYTTIEEHTNALRGKIDLYQTKRLQSMKIRRFDCIHDEFSPDNQLNQVLKATTLLMIHHPEVSQKQKVALRRVMSFFSSITDIDLYTVQWGRLQYHRNNRSYEMLMNICYMIWQSLLPSTSSGNIRFSLFDEESLPRLYETFLLEYYRQHYPALHATNKGIDWDIPEDTDPAMIRLLPGMHSDITLRGNGLTLIIDAKFYQHALSSYMSKQMLHSANLYQIYTYVKNEDKSGSRKVGGLLLYARTTEEMSPFLSVVMGGNQIGVQSLDLNSPFREISSNLDSIVESFFGSEVHRIA